MDRIHKKSALTKSKEMILAAHEQGEGLLWGRYEQQLPLCAFTANGLNCRKCFNGPCRINPFGDEPSRGICGADRDQIVMENLFQATMEGVLETARSISLLNGTGTTKELPDIAPDLPWETQRKLSEMGLLPVHQEQLFEVQNSYFSHKGYLLRTLKDLTRLGLIQYGFWKKAEALANTLRQDEPPFDALGANILLVGQPPLSLIHSLKNQARGKGINLYLAGAKIAPSVPAIADHGTPELALAMNLDALVIAPDASWPALEALAKKFAIPEILIDETKSVDQISSQVAKLALAHRQNASYITPSRITPTTGSRKGKQSFFDRAEEIKGALKAGRIQGIVVMLGEPNVKQTFFERTLTLMENCLNRGCLVLLGDAWAAQANLLDEELAKRIPDRLSSRLAYFPSYEIPKVVVLLKDLSQGRAMASIPAVIAFPEFFRASTWATAVSFLSLGFAVQIGTPLPFWGSPAISEILLKDWPKLSGGTLMASPSLPSSQAQAEEILSFLQAQKL